VEPGALLNCRGAAHSSSCAVDLSLNATVQVVETVLRNTYSAWQAPVTLSQ